MNKKIVGLTLLLLCLTVSAMAQRPKKYNLKVGDQFKVTATIEQDIVQSMLGQQIETKQTITTVDLYEVVAVTSNSYKMKTTGLSRSLYTETGGGSVSMDSDMDGDEHLAFKVLTNKSYYVNMNKYGKFMGFEGMDDFKRLVKSELEGTLLDGQGDQLLTAFDDEALGTAFDGQFYIYPEPGKPWNRDADMKVNNLPISVSYDFSWDGNDAIKATGVMVMSGEIEVMGQTMTADMAGDQTSRYVLDRGTGLPKTIITEQEMDGSLEVQDLDVPMTLKTRVEVKLTR